MSNTKYLERFSQAGDAHIAKLFWIASCWETYDLKSFLNDDVPDEDYERYLPEVFGSKYFGEYRTAENIQELLYDYDRLGFIAEVLFPICSKFSYNEDGSPSSWTHNGGHCRMTYIYAETAAALLKEIEKEAKRWFKIFLEEDKEIIAPNDERSVATDDAKN